NLLYQTDKNLLYKIYQNLLYQIYQNLLYQIYQNLLYQIYQNLLHQIYQNLLYQIYQNLLYQIYQNLLYQIYQNLLYQIYQNLLYQIYQNLLHQIYQNLLATASRVSLTVEEQRVQSAPQMRLTASLRQAAHREYGAAWPVPGNQLSRSASGRDHDDRGSSAPVRGLASSNGGVVSALRSSNSWLVYMADSASRHTWCMVRTASSGKSPLAVSPDSMTQSAPSSTALATSEISARVGRGLLIMDSSIWVAQITGLPARLHLRKDLLRRNLDAQVASSNHNTVGSLHNLVKASNAFVILNFGNNFYILASLAKNMPDLTDGIRIPDEGGEHHVQAEVNREFQILAILLRHRRQVHRRPRQLAAVLDFAEQRFVANLLHQQADQAVVYEYPAAFVDHLERICQQSSIENRGNIRTALVWPSNRAGPLAVLGDLDDAQGVGEAGAGLPAGHHDDKVAAIDEAALPTVGNGELDALVHNLLYQTDKNLLYKIYQNLLYQIYQNLLYQIYQNLLYQIYQNLLHQIYQNLLYQIYQNLLYQNLQNLLYQIYQNLLYQIYQNLLNLLYQIYQNLLYQINPNLFYQTYRNLFYQSYRNLFYQTYQNLLHQTTRTYSAKPLPEFTLSNLPESTLQIYQT
uniref:Mediator of RNA polymerase II transcription subunit 13 n=1 Tax=Macrostomum lignano TaxID=282301 RepID=A0A1I8I972_9PLAT